MKLNSSPDYGDIILIQMFYCYPILVTNNINILALFSLRADVMAISEIYQLNDISYNYLKLDETL